VSTHPDYFRTVPTYAKAFVSNNVNDASWYRYFQDLERGIPGANELAIIVGASPFMYPAPRGGFIIINGGTVSKVEFTRTLTYNTGQTQGCFPVSLGDQLTVSWSVKPTMTFVPT
jgi:hypothetical protein